MHLVLHTARLFRLFNKAVPRLYSCIHGDVSLAAWHPLDKSPLCFFWVCSTWTKSLLRYNQSCWVRGKHANLPVPTEFPNPFCAFWSLAFLWWGSESLLALPGVSTRHRCTLVGSKKSSFQTFWKPAFLSVALDGLAPQLGAIKSHFYTSVEPTWQYSAFGGTNSFHAFFKPFQIVTRVRKALECKGMLQIARSGMWRFRYLFSVSIWSMALIIEGSTMYWDYEKRLDGWKI